MFKSLSFYKRRKDFREIDFFYSVFTCLAILIVTTFNDFIDTNIIKIFIVTGLIILYLSIRYCKQTIWYKPCTVKKVFGNKNLCDKGYEDKWEYDLHGKKVKDKKDASLYIGRERWDKIV